MGAIDRVVYVSCGGDQNILRYSMDRESGDMELLGKTSLPVDPDAKREERPSHGGLATVGAPLAVSPDATTLYASLRIPPICVVSYRIDRETGELEMLAKAPVPAPTPFILAESAGNFLLGAAYYGNCAWVSAVEPDGSVGAAPIACVEGITTPHSVLVHPNRRFAYVAATGHEEIHTFRFDTGSGTLCPTGTPGSSTIAGASPRHMALHPDARLLFCMNETSGIISSFMVDLGDGSLTLVDSADPRPAELREGHGIGADLHISPDGRFLYASERVRSTISVHAVDAATGKLTFVEAVEVGKFPRSFAIDSTGRQLVVAGQGSNDLTVLAIDPASGRLLRMSSLATGDGPIWVEIVELARP